MAVPGTYTLLMNWLEGFAYRVPIGAEPFLVALCAMLLLTLLTIGYRAIKAATANLVESLKYE